MTDQPLPTAGQTGRTFFIVRFSPASGDQLVGAYEIRLRI